MAAVPNDNHSASGHKSALLRYSWRSHLNESPLPVSIHVSCWTSTPPPALPAQDSEKENSNQRRLLFNSPEMDESGRQAQASMLQLSRGGGGFGREGMGGLKPPPPYSISPLVGASTCMLMEAL